MEIVHFFDKNTFTLTYIVFNKPSNEAIIIDPVLDIDIESGTVHETSINKVKSFLSENDLTLSYILETHAHADHISGADFLKKYYPDAKVVISEKIKSVQDIFAGKFNLDLETFHQKEWFDILAKDHETLKLGEFQVKIIPTPGHTPACVSYLIGGNLFTGDAIFMPDFGTGRCDFPGGSSETLYNSITQNIYTLPDTTNIFVGHDYQPNDRPLEFQTTVGKQKKDNIHICENVSKENFIRMRSDRDKQLRAPKLLLPSIQLNIKGGKLPEPESNGKSYLRIPLTLT